MKNRIKAAWSVLIGKSYAMPYATSYEVQLWNMNGKKQLEMSKMNNPFCFDPDCIVNGPHQHLDVQSQVT